MMSRLLIVPVLTILFLSACSSQSGTVDPILDTLPTPSLSNSQSYIPSASTFHPEETSPETPTDAKITIPEQSDKVHPAGTVGSVIVFMGERIVAPGSYPGVPDVYIPVLDDLYLYGEASNRYATLVNEGKWTQEVLREFEKVMSGIRGRGYTPYPYSGFIRATGYALIDLDNDNSPELLLLEDPARSSAWKQTPSIYSVFTIRNEKLIQIKNNTYNFQDCTILSADGIFYQCIDWQSIGYVDLNAFRLEAGKSEFTIVSEAHAALSFSEGEVPVPYWIEMVNGVAINIPEKEFNILLEQYRNPAEPMILNFVPLLPGGVIDIYDGAHPADSPVFTNIGYPPVYQGAPVEYKPILDDFYLLSERIRNWESIGESVYIDWEGTTGLVEFPHGELGYAIVDINNDGVPELLLGTIDELTNAAPNSVFTLSDGEPVLLTSFWSRNRGIISADGTIYSVGSGGAANTYLSSYRLDRNANTLTGLTFMGSDYSQSDDKPYYYQEENSRYRYITEEEFLNFLEICDNPLKIIELRAVPIAG